MQNQKSTTTIERAIAGPRFPVDHERTMYALLARLRRQGNHITQLAPLRFQVRESGSGRAFEMFVHDGAMFLAGQHDAVAYVDGAELSIGWRA